MINPPIRSDFLVLENVFYGAENPDLFQSPAFFKLHAIFGGVYFELVRCRQVMASIHFTPDESGRLWSSPIHGTYAGLSCVENLKLRDLFFFVERVEFSLRERGASQIDVVLPPQAHDESAFARQVYLWRAARFEIVRCDLNQSLRIDSKELSLRMSYGNLKRLRKSEREGLFAKSLPLTDLPRVYKTLEVNRASKGNALSMTLSQLQTMVESFPERIFLFGCQAEDSLAAAAICLRLNSEVLYVFYWGDRPEFSSYSLVVSLAAEIYRLGQVLGVKILDVGTSTIDREPNFGLIEFKRGLDFSESLKVRMRKSL